MTVAFTANRSAGAGLPNGWADQPNENQPSQPLSAHLNWLFVSRFPPLTTK
jgi:hypothetical protein